MILSYYTYQTKTSQCIDKYVTADLGYSNSGTPFPSQLLWKVDNAQPSVCARKHLTNLLRDELLRTGAKNEFNLTRYLMSRLPRILDEQRAPRSQFHQITH